MKKKSYILIIGIFMLISMQGFSQESRTSEKYGKTLNLGIGVGYYGYIGHNVPVLRADFEFDVVKNFTLAPSIGYYSYSGSYYWGNNNHPYRYYNYKQTIIPVGVKATYYFDNLLKANSKWDFYAAASLGVAFINSSWDGDYYGDQYLYKNGHSGNTPLYFDVHAGAEYHFARKVGVFLDLSTGVSTIGLGFHF